MQYSGTRLTRYHPWQPIAGLASGFHTSTHRTGSSPHRVPLSSLHQRCIESSQNNEAGSAKMLTEMNTFAAQRVAVIPAVGAIIYPACYSPRLLSSFLTSSCQRCTSKSRSLPRYRYIPAILDINMVPSLISIYVNPRVYRHPTSPHSATQQI